MNLHEKLNYLEIPSSNLVQTQKFYEDVFGWNRATVELGMNECRTKMLCVSDLSTRRKPKAEEKDPRLLGDIIEIMDPHSQAEARLRKLSPGPEPKG